MSTGTLLIVIMLALTLLGCGILVFITVKYYWGERGTPPLTGEARRMQKERELQLRAKQIELAKRTRRAPRSPDFFDNRKRPD
jgi:hypothetical protein